MQKTQANTAHCIAPTSLPHSAALLDHLKTQLSTLETDNALSAVTLNFKDSSYSPHLGGYHPVEIRLSKVNTHKDAQVVWQLEYITEFAYQGQHFPELDREIDFDFANGCFYSPFLGWKTLRDSEDAIELYTLWEGNFLSYLDMGAFDLISLTTG